MKTINRKISLINFTDSNRAANKIEFIVWHYVGGTSTAKNNADYFYNRYCGASAHYFVDSKEIWQVVEDNDAAWHCGTKNGYKHPKCRNSNSIGIEICCKKDINGNWYFEEETLKNAIELGQYLMEKYPQLKDESRHIRHYDVTGKICPQPFVKHVELWEDFKKDLFKKEEEKTEPIIYSETKVEYLVEVTASCLNVRKEPSLKSDVKEQITSKGPFTIVGEVKNTEDGITWGRLRSGAGWISLAYTKKLTTTTETKKVSKTMEVTAKAGLNVRKTPGGTKVGVLVYGSIVTVTEEKDGWSKIGEDKWVSNQYLKETTKTISTKLQKGDIVKIKSSAKKYATGQTIPNRYKNQSYTIVQKESKKSLLKEIMSWVNDVDLTK